MTQDEIIEMARKAGFLEHKDQFYTNHEYGDCKLELVAFANLVAAKAFQNGYEKGISAFNEAVGLEREACAQVCETRLGPTATEYYGETYAEAIRARGEQA